MTQSEKRLLAIISIALLILSGCILIHSYMRISENRSLEETIYGYYSNTESTQHMQTQNGDTVTSAITFAHSIYTSEQIHLADLAVTVKGVISPTNCTISHLSATLSEKQWDGLTVSEHITNDTATVILFLDQLSICHFQYRIFPDGNISFLK